MLLCLLAACNTTGSYFRGAPPTRVTVEGSTFDVRVRAGLAEAIRINPQYAPRLGPIADRAQVAIEHVSGCRVMQILGDQAQVLGVIDCGDGRGVTNIILVPGGRYECYRLGGPFMREHRWLGDLQCDPI